jgi:hypothetical protein
MTFSAVDMITGADLPDLANHVATTRASSRLAKVVSFVTNKPDHITTIKGVGLPRSSGPVAMLV